MFCCLLVGNATNHLTEWKERIMKVNDKTHQQESRCLWELTPQQLDEHPAGLIELTDDDLKAVAGGSFNWAAAGFIGAMALLEGGPVAGAIGFIAGGVLVD